MLEMGGCLLRKVLTNEALEMPKRRAIRLANAVRNEEFHSVSGSMPSCCYL